MADPISASITAIVTAVASSLGASAATAATIATITTAAVQTAAVIAAVSAARPKVDANGSPIQWRADPDAPIPFLHGGPLKVAGTIVARKAFGPENMYQGIVSVVSGAGPVAGPVSWEVERQPITFDGTQKAAAPYGDKLWLSYQVGAQPTTAALQSPPGLRAGADMPGWATTAKLSGKAAYMVTLGHDSKGKIWTRGEPEFGGVWQGLGCWDPRADSTYPGGSGTQRYDEPTTWPYTNNPILNGLRWAMGEWEGQNGGVPYLDKLVGGMGLTLDEIDVASFVEGANVADALGLTMAGLATTDDDKWQVLSAMLQAGGCAPITIDGKLTCMVRVAARTSVLTLARGDITGAIEMVRSPSRLERINTVIPRYRSEAHDWEMVSADPVSRTEYVDEDGGVKRSRQIAYSYVTDLDQATMLAAYDIADAREGFVGGVPVMPYLRELRPGDAFTLPATDDLGPLSGKKMLLLSREFDPATGDLAFGVREETDGKHVWAGGLTGTVADPVTYDPPSLTFAAPDAADWSLSAGAGATPSVVLTGEVTNPLADAVLVEVMLDGGTVWSPGVTTDETNVELIEAPVPSGGAWLASVRYRSAQTQIWGDRLALGPVTVTGPVINWDEQLPPSPVVTDSWDLLRAPGGGLAGPLAISALTEAKVQGRFFGEHAGDAAANTAGLQNGDAYVDTSVTPYAFKVKSGGVIKEVDTSGTFPARANQADVTAAAGAWTTMVQKDLTQIAADSYVTVWMGLFVERTAEGYAANTRKSGGGGGVNPGGSWRICEGATGALNPGVDPVLMSGSWTANRAGSGGSPDNIDNFDVDGSATAGSDISRRWLVRASGSRTWYLQMTKSGGESLLDAGVAIYVQIQRNPLN